MRSMIRWLAIFSTVIGLELGILAALGTGSVTGWRWEPMWKSFYIMGSFGIVLGTYVGLISYMIWDGYGTHHWRAKNETVDD